MSTNRPLPKSDLEKFELYIGGVFRQALGGRTFQSIDPSTAAPWASIPDAGEPELTEAVEAAWGALKGEWARCGGAGRATAMLRLADAVERNIARLAATETRDNGKVRRDAEAQVTMIPKWLRYFAGLADKTEGRVVSDRCDEHFVYTRREPIGVVGAILPWNAPLLLMTYKLAPALAAGCTFIAKPSEFAPASILEFARVVHEAGLPAGVFNAIAGSSRELGAAVAAHPRIARVAFTGSGRTGVAVAKAAADHIGRVTLELGGKSPQLVFADCDIESAVNGVVAGVFAASGQMCHAGSRVFVERSIYETFKKKLTQRASEIRIGNPSDPHTDMGPISTLPQLRRIEELLAAAKSEGAQIIYGGSRHGSEGYYFQPTVLTNVKPTDQIAREEVFGPVVIVTPFDDEDSAVSMANDTVYGLAAGLWTLDVRRAHRVAERLEAGTIWVNCYRVASPAVPFGGTKQSGVGRENGSEALLEYLDTKSVWIGLSSKTADPFRMSEPQASVDPQN